MAAGFRFHHAMYQEVLYGLLPPGHRIQLHRLIAVREETGYGERAIEVAAELAHHYSRANDKGKAIKYLKLAAERTVARGAVVEAENHYRRALDLLGELPQDTERDRQELALEVALGRVLWSSKSWSHPEAARAFARAERLAENLGETAQLVLVLGALVGSALGSGQYKLAGEVAGRMLQAAERGGDCASLCAAHSFLGQTFIWRVHYVDAQRHLELASNYYEAADHSEISLLGIDAPALRAIVVLLLGFPERARQLMNEALRRIERRRHPFWAGMVHMWAGMLFTMLHDVPAVMEHAEALRQLISKQPVWAGPAELSMARALILQGRWKEGERHLQKAKVLHETAGIASQLIRAKLDEAGFLAHEARIDDGLAIIADALADSEELAQIRAPALRQRAELLAQSGEDTSAVEAVYRAAIECARVQRARYYELQAATSFAQWLKAQRRAAAQGRRPAGDRADRGRGPQAGQAAPAHRQRAQRGAPVPARRAHERGRMCLADGQRRSVPEHAQIRI
jgi:tetratricopeptide (TPR) repeat protein